MIFRIIDALVKLVLYACVFGGSVYLFRSVWISAWGTARIYYTGAAQRRQLKTAAYYHVAVGSVVQRRATYEEYIQDLLESTLKSTGKNTARTFHYVSLGLACGIALIVFLSTGNVLLPVIPGLLFLFVPFVLLRVQKYRLSIRNSYDIAPAITLLATKYPAERKNMAFALDKTIDELPDSAISRALSRLLIKLRQHVSEEDAIRALASFNNQTGTSWATQLSSIIYDAFVEGIDVEESLVELSDDITKVQGELKKQRLDRTDTVFVAATPMIALPAGIGYLYLRVTRDTLHYQFGTPKGVGIFIFAATATLISLILAIVFYRPKQDI